MPLRSAETQLEILSEAVGHETRPGHLLHHGWDGDALRQTVLEGLFPNVVVRLTTKSACALH